MIGHSSPNLITERIKFGSTALIIFLYLFIKTTAYSYLCGRWESATWWRSLGTCSRWSRSHLLAHLCR